MEMKFYVCKHCGNIIAFVKSSGAPVTCCGEKMTELVPNTIEASTEKHIPVIIREGGIVKVNVGSVDHPMLPEHHIEWIAIETAKGNQRKALTVGGAPSAVFLIEPDDEIISAFAYCNLHGLWKA